jgi:hypothetical protein
MDVSEPRVRRRGFFLHSSDTNEVETGEHENAEGFAVRFRTSRSTASRRFSSGGRQATLEQRTEEDRLQIRSGSVTGSRQRAHLLR